MIGGLWLPAELREEAKEKIKKLRKEHQAHDEIRVYFKHSSFFHAFFESTHRNGIKDRFSPIRAERINWIKATLSHPLASLLQGWDNKRKCHLPDRRVEVVYEDFVVVL